MKKRNVLMFFLVMSMFASTVFPVTAAENMEYGGTIQEENADPESSSNGPKSAADAEGSEGPSEPGDPTVAEGSSKPGDPTEAGGPSEPGDLSGTGEPSKPGDPTEAEEPSGQAGPSEDGEPAETENVETVTVLGEAVSVVLYSASGDETDTLLAEFDFDDKSLTDGADITTDNAQAKGSYSLGDSYTGGGNALYLNGSQYLTVTKEDGSSLLTGLTELTVSMELKLDRTDASNWAFYAAPNEAGQIFRSEKYIGLFSDVNNDNSFCAERYNSNEQDRPEQPSAAGADDWVHVDVVFDENETILYVDGVEAGRESSGYGLKDILGENSILWIGKANWGSGEYFKGWIDDLRIYSGALTANEIQDVPSEAYKEYELSKPAASLEEVLPESLIVSSSQYTFPGLDGAVTWQVPEDGKLTDVISMDEDGLTAEVTQPAAGSGDAEGEMLAVISGKYGKTKTETVSVTVKDLPEAEEAYGYLMVHFIEDSDGYAEKIYLDISVGDDPEKWYPLNGGNPVLASNLGTTGARDPYLTYNPETETYYIIATDLRVFEGDDAQWTEWQISGSTMMNVWESKDLITWSDVRQFDVALDADGNRAYLGMMWAPEATWVPDYYGEEQGAFVVYWSSDVYTEEDRSGYTSDDLPKSDIVWGVTTDFTQDTYSYQGVFLDGEDLGGIIDTTILEDGETTYHLTRTHGGRGIIMASTSSDTWWKDDTPWTIVQENIGENYGPAGVEGPAVLKDHTYEGRWYLFVDAVPGYTADGTYRDGYYPMISNSLSEGWEYLDSDNYFLTKDTKHGGILSLTGAQYEAILGADAKSAVKEDLGTVQAEKNMETDRLKELLPKTAAVNLYSGKTGELPVQWDLSGVDLSKPGEYKISGEVICIGSNNDAWVGKDGSVVYNAEDRQLYSTTSIIVYTTVVVKESEDEQTDGPEDPAPKDDSKSPERTSSGGGSSRKHHSSSSSESLEASVENVASVQTGDAQTAGMWMLLGLSAGIMCLMTLKKAKK